MRGKKRRREDGRKEGWKGGAAGGQWLIGHNTCI